jgi:hypothetical protein
MRRRLRFRPVMAVCALIASAVALAPVAHAASAPPTGRPTPRPVVVGARPAKPVAAAGARTGAGSSAKAKSATGRAARSSKAVGTQAAPSKAAPKSTGKSAGKSARTSTRGSAAAPKASVGAPTLLFNELLLASEREYGPDSARYLVVYQAADPGADSGRIDAARVVAEVRRLLLAQPDVRWGILDFEHPYNEILLAGPSDHRHAAASASMIETIRRVRSEFPRIRWTYYGMPRLPYWNAGDDWSRLSPDRRRTLFDHAQASYGAILNELDWIQPTVYDKYERGLGFPLAGEEASDRAERAFRIAHVEVVRDWFARTGQPQRPLYPVVTPWFLGTDKSTQYRAIPTAELVADQLRPLVDAGADGISVWSSMEHKITIATIDFTPNSEFSRLAQPIVRETFARDVLGATGASAVHWQDPLVKQRLESHVAATMEAAVRSMREELARRGALDAPVGIATVPPESR